jgi:four helix bundle protein
MTDLKKMSERTLELQCAVIDTFRRVSPGDEAERGLWEELLKTLRSLSDNSAESNGTQSRKDFIPKFHICLKEGRESLQLLRALIHATPGRALELRKLAQACNEIVAILVVSLKTAKANQAAEERERRRHEPKRWS